MQQKYVPALTSRALCTLALGAFLASTSLAQVPLDTRPEVLDEEVKRTVSAYPGALVVADLETGRVYAHGPELDVPASAASTFKLVTAYAALDAGRIHAADIIDCIPYKENGKTNRCWKNGGHGPMDIIESLAVSCNLYFHKLYSADMCRRVVDLALSRGYVLLDAEPFVPRAEIFWHGDTLKITPRNQLRMLLGLIPAEVHPSLKEIALPFENREALEIIRIGMEECVRSGSGVLCRFPGMPIAGKTGSWKGTRWFVSYAPSDAPKIAVVAFSRGGGVRRGVEMSRKFYTRIMKNDAVGSTVQATLGTGKKNKKKARLQ